MLITNWKPLESTKNFERANCYRASFQWSESETPSPSPFDGQHIRFNKLANRAHAVNIPYKLDQTADLNVSTSRIPRAFEACEGAALLYKRKVQSSTAVLSFRKSNEIKFLYSIRLKPSKLNMVF